MTRYRGFVNYPDRLKNYVAEKEQPSEYRSFLPHIIDLEPNSLQLSLCHVSCMSWPCFSGKIVADQ